MHDNQFNDTEQEKKLSLLLSLREVTMSKKDSLPSESLLREQLAIEKDILEKGHEEVSKIIYIVYKYCSKVINTALLTVQRVHYCNISYKFNQNYRQVSDF